MDLKMARNDFSFFCLVSDSIVELLQNFVLDGPSKQTCSNQFSQSEPADGVTYGNFVFSGGRTEMKPRDQYRKPHGVCLIWRIRKANGSTKIWSMTIWCIDTRQRGTVYHDFLNSAYQNEENERLYVYTTTSPVSLQKK